MLSTSFYFDKAVIKMSSEIATFKTEVSQIFNPVHASEIRDIQITNTNLILQQKDILQTYLLEQKLDAVKAFNVKDDEGRSLNDIISLLVSTKLRQDYLTNDNLNEYSAFLDTSDASGASFAVNFAGFSLYEKKIIGEENEVEWFTKKEFSIFRLKFFSNPHGGKICARLELKNRRRTRNQINYFREEVDFIRDWINEYIPNLRLTLIDVREFYYQHKFDNQNFEQLGYYVSDILDDFDENLPVELKFKPTKNHLKPSDIYFEIDKHVRGPLKEQILKSIENIVDEDELDKIEEELLKLKYSKYFFESAYKAFEKGVGHLRKIEKVDDKDIAFRFDFPQNESGVIKVDNQNGGKYLKYIDNELNKYLSKI